MRVNGVSLINGNALINAKSSKKQNSLKQQQVSFNGKGGKILGGQIN